MPIDARRKHLDGLTKPHHHGSNLGLYFNRYAHLLDEKDDKGASQTAFLNALCGGLDDDALELYRCALTRWRQVAEQDSDTEVFEMETVSPLLCGMGNRNALEIGATFMHPYGMPYIPGSSIKGVASSYAERVGGDTWRKANAEKCDGGDASVTLFGGVQRKQSFAAAVDVLDAWWVPDDQGRNPFALDILTPHYKNYYAGKDEPPDGTDSPNPVTFLVIKPGEKFLFAVRGQTPLRRLAKTLIRQAFETDGAGGKTRSGYGRLADILDSIRQAQTPEDLKKRLEPVKGEWYKKAQVVQACAEALKRFAYSQECDKYFKHALPARWLLERIKSENPATYAALNELRKTPGFDDAKLDRSDPDVREAFRLCVRALPPADIKEWLLKIAYTWDDLLTGKTANEILAAVEENTSWPPRADLPDAIRRLPHLSETDKSDLLELLTFDPA